MDIITREHILNLIQNTKLDLINKNSDDLKKSVMVVEGWLNNPSCTLGKAKLIKKIITFYFSFCEIIEGRTEEEIIYKAEQMSMKKLGKYCFKYFDNRTIEDVV